MTDKILITTTHNVENAEIIKYIGLITTNAVVGTNVFSDFKASVTDFFGGYSETYQSKLEQIYQAGIKSLTQKAKTLNANGVIGVKIDFDEISGKSKSMFMVSITGTAVIFKLKNVENTNLDFKLLEDSSIIITQEELNSKVHSHSILTKAESLIPPTKKEWEYIFANQDIEIGKALLHSYLNGAGSFLEDQDEFINYETSLLYFLKQLNSNEITDIIFEELKNNNSNALNLIFLLGISSLKYILELLQTNNTTLAIQMLEIPKSHYTKDDLNTMELIQNELNNMKDLGSIKIEKSILGKDKKILTCPRGHQSQNQEYCPYCKLDIKGIKEEDNKKIIIFNDKVSALRELFKSRNLI